MDDIKEGRDGCGVEECDFTIHRNCEESDYSRLTLLEKRNRNIERNKNFFLALFNAPAQDSPANCKEILVVEKKREKYPQKIEGEKLDSAIFEEQKRREDIVTSLSGYFPHRREVLQRLVGYLDPVSFVRFCLLHKSDCVTYCLNDSALLITLSCWHYLGLCTGSSTSSAWPYWMRKE